MSFWKRFGNNRRRYKIIAPRPRLFVLGEKTAEGWHSCFLWCGTFGNYLIGLPRSMEPFKQIIAAKGGVKAILLTREENHFQSSAETLFQFAGAYLIAGDVVPSWQIPSYRHHAVYHHDFRFKWLGKNDGGNSWLIETADCHLLVGRTTVKDQKTCGTNVVMLQESIADNDLEKVVGIPRDIGGLGKFGCSLSEFFTSRRVIHYYNPALPLIAVFDDIEFERNDFEAIGPTARSQLTKLLQEYGASQKSGQLFSMDDNEIHLVGPNRALASDPLDCVTIKDDRLTIVTPTQYWMALLEADIEEPIRQKLAVNFAATLPFNWRKTFPASLVRWEKNSTFMKRLRAKQKNCIEHYKRRRPKGILGAISQ